MPSRSIEDLKAEIQPYVRKFLDEANKLTTPWATFITDGYRTPQEQDALYQQGRTKPGPIVTNAKGLPICESNHCRRIAIDVAFQKSGQLSYDASLYGKIVTLAKSLGASWGGDWLFSDKPHFEWTGQLPPLGDNSSMPGYTQQDLLDEGFKVGFETIAGRNPTTDEFNAWRNSGKLATTYLKETQLNPALQLEGFKVAFKAAKGTSPTDAQINAWRTSGKTASEYVRENYLPQSLTVDELAALTKAKEVFIKLGA